MIENGVVLGYECKIYYDYKIMIEKVSKSVTTLTVRVSQNPKNDLPRAVSVAAILDSGVGKHSPLLRINLPG